MKERINRLARGIIDGERPRMSWQPEAVAETVRYGAVTKREFSISSVNRLNVKGFVYSSNPRVRILGGNNSFGGVRIRIAYEVDASFLAPGETIEGSFSLVTNCGEEEIPYSFTIGSGAPGEKLGGLVTAEDFLHVAELDQETALRLLDYQGFTSAPFMQDLHVRALFDGLRGYGSRQNFMEEFLISLGVKHPVRLMTDEREIRYENLTEHIQDAIIVRSDSWGYIRVDMETDGDFIYLPRKSFTHVDFSEGILQIPYVILPEHLHAGKNSGYIRIRSRHLRAVIPVTVMMSGERETSVIPWQKELLRYMDLRRKIISREDYTQELGELRRIADRMLTLAGEDGDARAASELIRQDVEVLDGSRPIQDLVDTMLHAGYSGGRSGETGSYYLHLLEISRDMRPEDGTEPGMAVLEQMFSRGCRSPFLYEMALVLLKQDAERLDNPGSFEIHTMFYAVRKAEFGRELAIRCAAGAGSARRLHPLTLPLLMELYRIFPEKEILSAVCATMIRQDKRGPRWFEWYERGINKDVSLTRLYEYYLASLPGDYGRLLPEKVLIYFAYTQDMDVTSRENLYWNILTYAKPNSQTYRDFAPSMERFALEQLFQGKIDNRLAVIYRKMIVSDLIDQKLARVLPPILRATRIRCRDQEMRYVVVVHEELMVEDAYPLENGYAFVPVFSDRDVILMQDSYGNRYTSVRYDSEPAMQDVDALVERCFEVNPEQPLLLVNACHEAAQKEMPDEQDSELLIKADRTVKLHPLFRDKMVSAVLRYYQMVQKKTEIPEEGLQYLLQMDKRMISQKQRTDVCGILIDNERYDEAWEMVRTYMLTELPTERLSALVGRLILDSLFAEDPMILSFAMRILGEGKADTVLLDYLCEHFNGTTEQMYGVLVRGLREHVETYDLEERLVAQMLFTGNTGKMDAVFDLYAGSMKTSENVVRAYFTVRSAEYFFQDKAAGDRVFAYLEGMVDASSEKDKVPDIYLIALTKYYSTLSDLTPKQRDVCQSVVNSMIDSGMVFSYFKDLARFVIIPGDILDKEIIEYHGSRERFPYLRVRILPEEESYHYEEMRQVYQGVYIREKVLFEGEIMEYQIEEETDEGRIIAAEGSISCREVVTRAPGNRFASLNEMSLALDMKNEADLQQKMTEYLKKDAAVEQLFTLQ
ncbi:MAG: hypothetical protein J5947_00360 [Clostridium sp.]|nr:hypothetical protein [Clostridium sp.]